MVLKKKLQNRIPGVRLTTFGLAATFLKITFDTEQNTQNCIDHGLLLDWLHVTSHDVKREELIDITICNHCLMFEDHVSSKCPQKANNPQFQRCSLCCANDHHYINCNAPPSLCRCLHCGGEHHAKPFKMFNQTKLNSSETKVGLCD